MTIAPILCRYDAETRTFRAARRFQAQCDNQFCDQEYYTLEVVDEEQSGKDRAFHAEMRELYATLPERFDGQFPQYDDFRGHCLIQCRYAFVNPIACETEKRAREVARAIMSVKRKGYSIVSIEGTVVNVIQAMSQAIRGGDMKKEQRYESYRDVLDYAKGLIGLEKGK